MQRAVWKPPLLDYSPRMRLDPAEVRQRITPLFEENFEKLGDLGAAVSIWQDGKSILELHGGFHDARHERRWETDTIVLVWSATKGIGSACLLHVMQESGISAERRVADFWPEFAQNGKADITMKDLMAHSAGLCALDAAVDVLDYAAVIRALENQAPLWPPSSAHGYHARTYGFLIDELVRRIAGASIGQYWRTNFADPLRLDFWIGLPNELNDRVATSYAAKAGKTPSPEQFYADLAKPGTLQRRTFTSPRGLNTISAMNNPAVRAQPIVSFGGIGSASALAKFYAMLANEGMMNGQRYFDSRTIRRMAQVAASGVDRIFEIPTAFSAGFMMDPPETDRRIFGPGDAAFGHPGAGGSHAFADPTNRIGFAYVCNRMEQSVLPGEKSLRLVDAIYP
jgi:CubicO group peptidase (beta-lactamase class C family)